MENEFVPYDLALELKKLGFDEPCMYIFDNQRNNLMCPIYGLFENEEPNRFLNAPLYQQAFRWFREKYGLYGLIDYHLTPDLARYTILKENDLVAKVLMAFGKYEKAELECLKKLIEIVKEK